MKEVFTKGFWKSVKKTFEEAREDPPTDKVLPVPVEAGQAENSSTSETTSSPPIPSEPPR
jgi:hypothetical protein